MGGGHLQSGQSRAALRRDTGCHPPAGWSTYEPIVLEPTTIFIESSSNFLKKQHVSIKAIALFVGKELKLQVQFHKECIQVFQRIHDSSKKKVSGNQIIGYQNAVRTLSVEHLIQLHFSLCFAKRLC